MFLISILLVQYVTNYIYRRVLFPTSRKVKQGILNNILEKLEKAKKSVMFCLENNNGLVDFKGIVYWATEVENLRKQIDEML